MQMSLQPSLPISKDTLKSHDRKSKCLHEKSSSQAVSRPKFRGTPPITAQQPSFSPSNKSLGISTRLCELAGDAVVRSLGVEVAVEEQGVLALAPRVLVANTPDGDANALGSVEAGLDNGRVVVGRGVPDVELGDGNLGDSGRGELLQSALDGGAAALGDVCLGA